MKARKGRTAALLAAVAGLSLVSAARPIRQDGPRPRDVSTQTFPLGSLERNPYAGDGQDKRPCEKPPGAEGPAGLPRWLPADGNGFSGGWDLPSAGGHSAGVFVPPTVEFSGRWYPISSEFDDTGAYNLLSFDLVGADPYAGDGQDSKPCEKPTNKTGADVSDASTGDVSPARWYPNGRNLAEVLVGDLDGIPVADATMLPVDMDPDTPDADLPLDPYAGDGQDSKPCEKPRAMPADLRTRSFQPGTKKPMDSPAKPVDVRTRTFQPGTSKPMNPQGRSEKPPGAEAPAGLPQWLPASGNGFSGGWDLPSAGGGSAGVFVPTTAEFTGRWYRISSDPSESQNSSGIWIPPDMQRNFPGGWLVPAQNSFSGGVLVSAARPGSGPEPARPIGQEAADRPTDIHAAIVLQDGATLSITARDHAISRSMNLVEKKSGARFKLKVSKNDPGWSQLPDSGLWYLPPQGVATALGGQGDAAPPGGDYAFDDPPTGSSDCICAFVEAYASIRKLAPMTGIYTLQMNIKVEAVNLSVNMTGPGINYSMPTKLVSRGSRTFELAVNPSKPGTVEAVAVFTPPRQSKKKR